MDNQSIKGVDVNKLSTLRMLLDQLVMHHDYDGDVKVRLGNNSLIIGTCRVDFEQNLIEWPRYKGGE